MGLDRIKLDWCKHQRGGADWTGLSRTAFRKTELEDTASNWTGLSLPELDFTRLHYTALPWIELESTIQDSQFTALSRLICTEVHCTFPNETDKDCTTLHCTARECTPLD